MKTISTRLLLSCAAVGVAGGILFIANAYIGNVVIGVLPMLYGLTLGVYFLPGIIGQRLFRRAGVGLLVATLSGLVSAAFQPLGFVAVPIAVGIGLASEVPFALFRYRRWSTAQFVLGSVAIGVVLAVGMYRLVGSENLDPVGALVLVIGSVVSPVVFTLLGLALGRALEATGVARGFSRTR